MAALFSLILAKGKLIVGIVLATALLGGAVSLYFSIQAKNTKITNLTNELLASKLKIDSLEKDAKITDMLNSLNIRLGADLTQGLKNNKESFSTIQSQLDKNFKNIKVDSETKDTPASKKRSEIIIDSIWQSFEVAK